MSSGISVQPLEVRLSTIWMLQPEYSSFRRALESNPAKHPESQFDKSYPVVPFYWTA